MPWQLRTIEQNGQTVQWMLEDSFQTEVPGTELPRLSRIRVRFAKTPIDYFWHPDESNDLEEIEDASTGTRYRAVLSPIALTWSQAAAQAESGFVLS